MFSQTHQIPPPDEGSSFWNGPLPPSASTHHNAKFPTPIKPVMKQEFLPPAPPPHHHHHHHHHHHEHEHDHDMSRSAQELGQYNSYDLMFN
jgi:hypothetical protein